MSESGPAGSAVRRWQLTETLRQLREQAGLTSDQTVAKLRESGGKWSRPKLSRIENREQGVKPREVEQLLDVYEVTDQSLRDWLIELASAPRERGIAFDLRKHLPEELHRFLDWEAALVARRQFETLLVPGLLQTADYARALITGIEMSLTEDEVERRVVARLARQRILSRATPPRLHAIIDVGVLERPVGGPRIMRDQLRRLEAAIETPNVTIQVLPKEVGASPALEGPFSILSLPDPVPDIGYAEGSPRPVYFEDRDSVRKYVLRFGTLTDQALSQKRSAKLIAEMAKSYDT